MTRGRRWLAAATAAISVTAIAVPVDAAGLEGIPHFDHVAVLVLANESLASTWGSGSPATYLNGLRAQGAFADQYFATGHVSLDNYVAMTSGQPNNQPVTGADCLAYNLYACSRAQLALSNGRNLADQLEASSLSWTGY